MVIIRNFLRIIRQMNNPKDIFGLALINKMQKRENSCVRIRSHMANIFFIASGVPLKYTLISMESIFSILPECFSRVKFSDKKSTVSVCITQVILNDAYFLLIAPYYKVRISKAFLSLLLTYMFLFAKSRASLRFMPSASAVLMVILQPSFTFCMISFMIASFTATQPPV